MHRSPVEKTPFLQGIPASSGVDIGTVVVVYPPANLELVPDRKASDLDAEERAFRAAVDEVQRELRANHSQLSSSLPAEEQALLDAYVLLAQSNSLISGTVERIRTGSWAPAALRDTVREHMQVFAEMEDAYLRARAHDIEDIGTHILARLQADNDRSGQFPPRCILVGRQISVVQVAEVPTEQLVGIVCMDGSRLSHTAILARALGVPAIMGIGEKGIGHWDGKHAIVDGHRGRLYLEPSKATQYEYWRLAKADKTIAAELKPLRHLPAETIDGVKLGLHVNAGLISDVPAALESGAEGVGLYRTEFGFMTRDCFPSEEEQYRTYRRILMIFAPKPVNIRVLDVGGDKPLTYLPLQREENPALGWRGIRILLDQPQIFITQLRALLRANAGLNNLGILLPMIVSVREIDEAVALLERTHRELTQAGVAATRPRIGIMVETPAATQQIAALAKRVDLLSIGTNDLTQHLLVVDRGNPQVADLCDSLHPAMLRVIHTVIQEAHAWGKPVSVCGEMAGDPAAALLLLGMGADTLSVAPTDIPRVKRIVRSVTREYARHLVDITAKMEDTRDIRHRLSEALSTLGLGQGMGQNR